MIKILLLVALVRLLCITNKPFLCSGIYTAAVFFFSLFVFTGGAMEFLTLLLAMAIRFALASLYFWLLHKTEGFIYGIILVCGLLIGLV